MMRIGSCSADKLIAFVIDASFTFSLKVFLAIDAHAAIIAFVDLSLLAKVRVRISDLASAATHIVLDLVLVLIAAALGTTTASEHANYVELRKRKKSFR